MANYSDIIGHEDIVKHFKNSIELGKVSHAYILNGEKGSGKRTLAAVVAKSLQCEEGGPDPCGKCRSCLQAESGNQPDIIWVNHEKLTIFGKVLIGLIYGTCAILSTHLGIDYVNMLSPAE